MTDPIGYIVLARRPLRHLSEPGYVEGAYRYEPVRMRGRDTGVVFTGDSRGLEQAQNAVEYCEKPGTRYDAKGQPWAPVDPVEYVVMALWPVGEMERLHWQVQHGGDHMCEECWPPDDDLT